jgi:hypothetical protein
MATVLFAASAYIYCFLVKNRKCPVPSRNKPAISFSGCGTRYQFYGGVAEYLLDNFETNNIDILCVSGGVYAGTILALGRKMTDWCDRDWNKCYDYWTKRSLNLFLDTDEFQRNMWRGYLPENAHEICSDRLFITISRLGFYGFYEDFVSEYSSNEELIDAIIGTIHIPGLFRCLPTVHSRFAFDGCFVGVFPVDFHIFSHSHGKIRSPPAKHLNHISWNTRHTKPSKVWGPLDGNIRFDLRRYDCGRLHDCHIV